MKRSVTETIPDKASVHTRDATFVTISAPEQDYFAPIDDYAKDGGPGRFDLDVVFTMILCATNFFGKL